MTKPTEEQIERAADEVRQCADILEKLVPQGDVESTFHGTNFGPNANPRDVIGDALQKLSADFGTGFTAISCCRGLGLVGAGSLAPTKTGRRYLYYYNRQALAQAAIEAYDSELAKENERLRGTISAASLRCVSNGDDELRRRLNQALQTSGKERK